MSLTYDPNYPEKKRAEERARLCAELPRIRDTAHDKHWRGKKAEEWVHGFLELLEAKPEGPYRTPFSGKVEEQFDNFFNYNSYMFLVEVKAHLSPVGADDGIDRSIRQIRRRPRLTAGLFIANDFTEGALQICREASREVFIILASFDEMELLLKNGGNFREWMDEKIKVLVKYRKPWHRPGLDQPLN